MHVRNLSLLLCLLAPCAAQTNRRPAPQPSQPSSSAEPQDDAPPEQAGPTQDPKAEAWTMLSSALDKQRHTQGRIQALAALGTLGRNPRSVALIESALSDPDLDIRTAAILAAGQTRAPSLRPALRRMLDDKEPQVAFTAASTLWKLGDHSGQETLVAVVDGERRPNAGLVSGSLHTMHKDLQSPSTLVRLGALNSAGLFLGPFGFGITAYEYIRKNGGDSARVAAVEEVAQQQSPAIRDRLIAALGDKDVGVRAAAAKALGRFHDPRASAALHNSFADAKEPVRLTAAAAYLLSTGAVAEPRRTAPPQP